jgi:hypothetical protein
MKTLLTTLLLIIVLTSQSKDRVSILTQYAPGLETSTVIIFGSVNDLIIGITGENTKDKEMGMCGYYMIGEQFKDCISIVPMLGYGTSRYNKRGLQIGVLAAIRIKVISLGVMYNSTSKLSYTIGFNFAMNR